MTGRIVSRLLAILFIALVGFSTDGCYRNRTVDEEIPEVHMTDLYASQYARNYYFVDTVYRRFWEQYHASPNPTLTPDMNANVITRLDLWMSVSPLNSKAIGQAVEMKAFLNLPSHNIGEQYSPGFAAGLDTTVLGEYCPGFWIHLVQQ